MPGRHQRPVALDGLELPGGVANGLRGEKFRRKPDVGGKGGLAGRAVGRHDQGVAHGGDGGAEFPDEFGQKARGGVVDGKGHGIFRWFGWMGNRDPTTFAAAKARGAQGPWARTNSTPSMLTSVARRRPLAEVPDGVAQGGQQRAPTGGPRRSGRSWHSRRCSPKEAPTGLTLSASPSLTVSSLSPGASVSSPGREGGEAGQADDGCRGRAGGGCLPAAVMCSGAGWPALP